MTRPSHYSGMRPWHGIARVAALAGWCALGLASASAATDSRIVERYRQMLAGNPVEGTALERLWKIASEEGFTDQLLEDYRKLAEQGDFTGQMVSGLLLHRAGREEESIAALRDAAKTDPKSPLPHLALARALPLAEKAAELEQAAALFPPSAPVLPDLLQETGDAWMAAGQPEKAATAWEKMTALNPGNLDLRQRLATLYSESGMTERAAAHYAYLEAHGDPATRANALRSLAGIRQAEGKADEALDVLEKAIALTSANNWMRADLITQMIRFSQQSNRTAELEARWKKAAEAAPRAPGSWLQLAELYAREGKPGDERTALEKVVELLPSDFAVKARLARLLVKLDDLPAAAAMFDAVMAADPGSGKNADLVFDRAELDVRLNNPDEARRRIETLTAISGGDEAQAARALAFFQQHRMFDALEAVLRKPNADPAALAEFLLRAQRPEEAREALKRLIKADDPPKTKAAQHQRASELLKQAGEIGAAIEELRAAAALEPDSRALHLALGDLCLGAAATESAANARAYAVEAFSRAFTLSRTDAEEAEADQRLFRAIEGGAQPFAKPSSPAKEPPSLKTAASRAATALLTAPGTPPSGHPSPSPSSDAALREFIATLQAKTRTAEGANDAKAWLRLARWHFWKRDLELARAAVTRAIALDPKTIPARELAVALAMASNDRKSAATYLEQLAELSKLNGGHPEPWLKQLAQLKLQMGQPEESLEILQGLAASGDSAALADLAQGQQQADRWYDALATWESLYASAKHARRYDFLQPLVRVMQRLNMHARVADLLWSAYQEQTDESVRSAILHDLIAQCQSRQTMSWLLEKLRAGAEKPGSSSFDTNALALALKADGQMDEAYRQLQNASLGAPDRAVAEESLTKEAETLRDFAEAARHQKLRLTFLPSPSATDWERLAYLQEAALDYAGADETRDGIVRRFPRDSEALLLCARYFEKWGNTSRAREILRAVRAFDPGNVPAAAGLVRLATGSEDQSENREAAEAVLNHARSLQTEESLLLPPAQPPLGNRLRAHFSTFGTPSPSPAPSASVTLFNERAHGATEREWRLEAIRLLALEARQDETERERWIARWQTRRSAEPLPSERLWALHYAGAEKEDFPRLIELAEQPQAGAARRGALLWSGLQSANWADLAAWLWSPGRNADDFEIFRTLLGEWCMLDAPLDIETLFDKAPLSQVWLCAETLATHGRLREAAEVGNRVFKELPSPVTQLGSRAGLALAQWHLVLGNLAEAEPLLRSVAAEPADSLDAPTYAAQRALCLLLPHFERKAWAEQTLVAAAEQNGRFASPVHATLTAALVQTLSGANEASRQALEKLVTLRPGSVSDAPATERVWNFLLIAGIQFQTWQLNEAAILLWERALRDEASIQLQGERVTAFASEIRMRLAAIKLLAADGREARRQLDALATQVSVTPLNQLVSLLESGGFKVAAARVLETIAEMEPLTPIHRLLSAYIAADETAEAEALVERWAAHPERDPNSAPAALEFMAARDLPRAARLAAALVEKSPGDPRLLEALARFQAKQKQWKEAEGSYARLVTMQRNNPAYLLNLADVLAAQGPDRHKEALKFLEIASPRSPEAATKRATLLIESGAYAQARIIASDLVRGEDATRARQLADAFSKHGRRNDGLALLASGVENAAEARKPRAAFNYQRELVLLAGSDQSAPSTNTARGLRRLRELAMGWPELLSAYFELTADSRWQSSGQRMDELLEVWDDGKGSPVAGAWLVSALLDTPDKEAPAAALSLLLERRDVQEPLLTWLDERCKRSNRHDLSLKISGVLLSRSPENADHAIRRALSLHALSRDPEASAILERTALRLVFTTDFTVGGRLALTAQEIGDPVLARDLFEQAVAADPAAQQTPVFLGYARLLLADGDFPAAKRVLGQAFRNPGNKDARAIVEYLRRSGRDSTERVPAELRDLELRPAVATEVERLLGER